jgi:chemotaxis signal transduction protein
MAIFSTLRSRRMANKQAQAVEQMIGFRLHQEWFALPILAIHKVIPLNKVYGDPQNIGISITTYEGQKLLVVDVAKQIFNDQTPIVQKKEITNSLEQNFLEIEQQRYLLILETEANDVIGLPIDSQPTMYRVETSAFKPLPDVYLEQGNIQCVSSEIIELPDSPPLFILNPQKLILSIKKK